MLVAANPLIEVRLGLMVWTIVCFGITFFVLKRFAFGAIQKMIDERRERIRRSIEEAEKARDEARRLLEEHRALIGQARGQAEQILAEARKVAESMARRVRKRRRPIAIAGSRRRSGRSRPRRSARCTRSAPRWPS